MSSWAKVLPAGYLEGPSAAALLPRSGSAAFPAPLVLEGRRRSHVRVRQGVSSLAVRPPGFAFEVQSCAWKTPRFGADAEEAHPLDKAGPAAVGAGVTGLPSTPIRSADSAAAPRRLHLPQLRRELLGPVLAEHLNAAAVSDAAAACALAKPALFPHSHHGCSLGTRRRLSLSLLPGISSSGAAPSSLPAP